LKEGNHDHWWQIMTIKKEQKHKIQGKIIGKIIIRFNSWNDFEW